MFVSGYTTVYSGEGIASNFTFTTIRDAGHMVRSNSGRQPLRRRCRVTLPPSRLRGACVDEQATNVISAVMSVLPGLLRLFDPGGVAPGRRGQRRDGMVQCFARLEASARVRPIRVNEAAAVRVHRTYVLACAQVLTARMREVSHLATGHVVAITAHVTAIAGKCRAGLSCGHRWRPGWNIGEVAQPVHRSTHTSVQGVLEIASGWIKRAVAVSPCHADA
eukprot:COSAG01_NODE_7297_length_3262_cov_8.165033_4_plen_220_part_00